MTAFTRTWNTALEAIPADANVVSQGAQRMRERWVDLRERLEVDHDDQEPRIINKDRSVPEFGYIMLISRHVVPAREAPVPTAHGVPIPSVI